MISGALTSAITRRSRACLPSSVLEPLWVQIAALLPPREVHHPLGCHRPRIPDRIVFDKLIQVLVFGCGYRQPGLLGHHPAPPPRRMDHRRGRRRPTARAVAACERAFRTNLDHELAFGDA
jgi:transposase